MEMVMLIPGELEHLENLVKVARKKKDAGAASNQRSNLETNVREDASTLKHALGNSDAVDGSSSLSEHGTNERMSAWEFESDSDSNKDSNEETQPVGPVDGESEFGDTELEDLVMMEGPQQILQLTLQNQADDFMKDEIINADDYADWI
ncbi:unnamed protein product [Sphagnum troendelagicum]|uniref:Uncharacterized protein n=1 Tax=Sphagnum troendelagicum TaxID=128251 RepID=A0ABP0UEX0_9BRYO